MTTVGAGNSIRFGHARFYPQLNFGRAKAPLPKAIAAERKQLWLLNDPGTILSVKKTLLQFMGKPLEQGGVFFFNRPAIRLAFDRLSNIHPLTELASAAIQQLDWQIAQFPEEEAPAFRPVVPPPPPSPSPDPGEISLGPIEAPPSPPPPKVEQKPAPPAAPDPGEISLGRIEGALVAGNVEGARVAVEAVPSGLRPEIIRKRPIFAGIFELFRLFAEALAKFSRATTEAEQARQKAREAETAFRTRITDLETALGLEKQRGGTERRAKETAEKALADARTVREEAAAAAKLIIPAPDTSYTIEVANGNGGKTFAYSTYPPVNYAPFLSGMADYSVLHDLERYQEDLINQISTMWHAISTLGSRKNVVSSRLAQVTRIMDEIQAGHDEKIRILEQARDLTIAFIRQCHQIEADEKQQIAEASKTDRLPEETRSQHHVRLQQQKDRIREIENATIAALNDLESKLQQDLNRLAPPTGLIDVRTLITIEEDAVAGYFGDIQSELELELTQKLEQEEIEIRWGKGKKGQKERVILTRKQALLQEEAQNITDQLASAAGHRRITMAQLQALTAAAEQVKERVVGPLDRLTEPFPVSLGPIPETAP